MREILELQLTLKSLYNCLQNTQTECQLKEANLQVYTTKAEAGCQKSQLAKEV